MLPRQKETRKMNTNIENIKKIRKMNANIENIIENIDDYVLGDCSAKQCGFSDNEVNEIYSTLISESRKKILKNAVKILSDEEYDDIVDKIAKTIYNARRFN